VTSAEARRADTIGLLLMVASAACFAAMAPFTRRWLRTIEPQSIVLARAAVMIVVFGGWGLARGAQLCGRDRLGLLVRGFVGWLAISCYVWSTQHLPTGQAVLLQYSHPVFVAAIGLTGALLSGIAYMTVRRISATEAPVTIVFWFALVMLLCSAIGAARAVAVTMAGPLFGLLFDRLFFGRTPGALALAGTLLVVGALALPGALKPTAAITEGEAE